MFGFRYNIEEFGWATAWVSNGDAQRELRVSYLHEPLSRLAWLACYLLDGENAGNAHAPRPSERGNRFGGSRILHSSRQNRVFKFRGCLSSRSIPVPTAT